MHPLLKKNPWSAPAISSITWHFSISVYSEVLSSFPSQNSNYHSPLPLVRLQSNGETLVVLYILFSSFHIAVSYFLPCLATRMHSINSSLNSNGTLWTKSLSFFSSPSTQRKSWKVIQHSIHTHFPRQMPLFSLLIQYKARGIHVGWFPLIPPGTPGCLCKDEYIVSSGIWESFKNW